MYGLFKKVVVADTLGIYINTVYGDVAASDPIAVLLATLFFTFQIYCDFSGYSDIAIGTARIFGFRLMENFKRPYLAKSVSEFWKRWHISLSSWFRDYVYIPVGGNRVVKWRWYYNLMLTFLVSGFWHGAAWTFIIWGGLHGLYLVLETMFQRVKIFKKDKAGELKFGAKAIKIAITFALVVFAWIFFRANSLEDAMTAISKIGHIGDSLSWNAMTAGKGSLALLINFLVIGLLLLSYALPMNLKLKRVNLFWTVTLVVILLLGQNATEEFIYFQF
jgi:alginate O-acetyltransferase complex protein AlgI